MGKKQVSPEGGAVWSAKLERGAWLESRCGAFGMPPMRGAYFTGTAELFAGAPPLVTTFDGNVIRCTLDRGHGGEHRSAAPSGYVPGIWYDTRWDHDFETDWRESFPELFAAPHRDNQ